MKKKINDQWQWGDKSHIRKVVSWYSSDNEQRFKQLEKRNLTDYWKNIKITYKFNEWGYRCDSFEKKCDVLFTGCSQAQGVGLPLKLIYSQIVSKVFKINHHSLAVAGADWQHVGQRLAYWLPILKPKALVLRNPPSNRFNWWDQETAVGTAGFDETEMMGCMIRQSRPLIDIIDNANAEWYEHSILSYIESLCKENKVELIHIPRKKYNHDTRYIGPKFARDYNHLGPEYHQQMADSIIEKLKEILH